ncbi:MAG: ATP-binding protein [Lachnospiraceae bacterium]|nr:ATP-binding protein [Lachnospiraceae bacterium]
MDSGQLFLPASHSGLQLLYKHYFIGVTEGNLVLPMKDFLHFLQIYTDYELAPFIKALSSVRRIDWLYCDEVENSLHPLMQGEMARWLIRMVNAGMHLIISSHGDTMTSRLNMLMYGKEVRNRKQEIDRQYHTIPNQRS